MQTEILLSGYSIDLYQDEPLEVIYSIADVKNVSSRSSVYSKQLRFPVTANNKVIFSHINLIDADSNFDCRRKVPAKILIDSVEKTDGYFQLLDVTNNGEYGEFVGVIFASYFDFISNLNDRELRDLDFSDFSYNFTQTEIENSWTATTGSGYVAAPIDYGYGWQYPQINSTDPIRNTELFPLIYAKTITDKIFSGAGFTYESNFFNSDRFKRLVITPSNNTDSNRPPTFANVEVSLSISGDPSNSPTSPAGICYWILNLQVFRNGAWLNLESIPYLRVGFFAPTPVTLSGSYFVNSNEQLRVNISRWGQIITICSGGFFKVTYDPTIQGSIYVGNPSTTQTFSNGTSNDVVQFPVDSVAPYNDTYDAFDTTTFTHTVPSLGFNVFIPANFKQLDFINSLITMFNLYIEVSKDDPRKLIIEPREDYYNLNTEVKDWTNKLDISSPIKSKFLSELQSKEMLFTYKSDNDYLNKKYFDLSKEIYGQQKIEFDNDFLIQKKKVEISFSPTPLQNVDNSQFIIIPRIYDLDNTNYSYSSYNTRILYYGGIKDIAPEKLTINYGAGIVNTYQYYPYVGHLDSPTGSTFDLNFGRADSISYSYNGLTGVTVTPNNLYHLYYEKYFDEISNKNSQLVTAKFNLTPSDISLVKFNDLIFVDTQYYRIHKIKYNELGNTLSEVELLKIEEVGVQLQSGKVLPTKKDGGGRKSLIIGQNNTGNYSSVVGVNNSTATSMRVGIIGSNNTIVDEGNNISIFGNNNLIGVSGHTSFIFGSYNTGNTFVQSSVLGGSGNTLYYGVQNSVINSNNNFVSGSNITIIGLNNFSALTSDTTYIGNLWVSGLTVGGSSVITNAANVGSGIGKVYSGKTGSTLLFKSFSAGTNLIVSNADDYISYRLTNEVISSSFSGENFYAVNYYSGATNLNSVFVSNGGNLVSGYNIYSGKTGSTLLFKSLIENSKFLEYSATSNSINLSFNNPVLCTDVDYTALTNKDWLIIVDKQPAAVTITLPSSPTDGEEFVIKTTNSGATYNTTIDGNGNVIDGDSTFVQRNDWQSTAVIYSSCATQWLISYDYIKVLG